MPQIKDFGAQEDTELEMLEWQMLITQPTPHHVFAPGRFSSKDMNHFSTHPRRRRAQRSLMTLWAQRSLLDEIQLEQTSLLLSRLNNWNFNAFTLDRLTDGRNLPTICTHLLSQLGLIGHFKLQYLDVFKFFYLVEQSYHTLNPYHNGVHAADVTQAMFCFLQESKIQRHLEPVEIVAALIAASCHDLDHPGKNEKFLITTSSHLAGLYNNSSVLENHHWRMTLAVLWESGLATQFSSRDREKLETTIKDMILATDISRQQEFLSRFKGFLDQGTWDLSIEENRKFILQIAMKCADISNPCRPWNISRLWSYRACEEFYRQGDREVELGLTVTPFCDRFHMSVAKVQAGFYRFVASPLFEEWNRFLSSALSTNMMHNLTSNQARWDLIVQQEARGCTSASLASQSSTTSSSSYSGPLHFDSRRTSMDQPCSSTMNTVSSQAENLKLGSQDRQFQLHLPSITVGNSNSDMESDDAYSSFPYFLLNNHSKSWNVKDVLLSSNSYSGEINHSSINSWSSLNSRSSEKSFIHLKRQLSFSDKRRILQPLCRPKAQHLVKGRSLDDYGNDKIEERRVLFELGSGDESEQFIQRELYEDKENLALLFGSRRGSAPSTLQFPQLQESVVISSMISNLEEVCSSRRGSLPTDLMSVDNCECHERCVGFNCKRDEFPLVHLPDQDQLLRRSVRRKNKAGRLRNDVSKNAIFKRRGSLPGQNRNASLNSNHVYNSKYLQKVTAKTVDPHILEKINDNGDLDNRKTMANHRRGSLPIFLADFANS